MDANDVGQVIDKVATYLDAIAQKLGVGVGKIWPWFVKQQYVEGARAALILAIFLPSFIYVARKASGVDWDDPSPSNVTYMILLVVLGCGALFGVVDFLCEFPDIFNPEYWAFKALLDSIR